MNDVSLKSSEWSESLTGLVLVYCVKNGDKEKDFAINYTLQHIEDNFYDDPWGNLEEAKNKVIKTNRESCLLKNIDLSKIKKIK